jgi:hypothetical protein
MTASVCFRPADDAVRWLPERQVPFREITFPSLRQALRDYFRGR